MNILDIILGVFLLFLIFKGLRKGFIKSVINLIGLLVIIIFITKFGYVVKQLLITKYGLSEIIAMIGSYILIALGILIIIRIIIKILHSIVDIMNLEWLNKLLGMLFGLFNGFLIIAILLALINMVPYSKQISDYVSHSKIVYYVKESTELVKIDFPNLFDKHGKLGKKVEEIKKMVNESTDKAKEKIKEKTK